MQNFLKTETLSFAVWNGLQVVCGAIVITTAIIHGQYGSIHDAILTVSTAICGGCTLSNGVYSFLFQKNVRLLNQQIEALQDFYEYDYTDRYTPKK